jgi:hypothetical protein
MKLEEAPVVTTTSVRPTGGMFIVQKRRADLLKGLYRTMSTTRPAPLLLTPSQASRLSPQKTVFIDASWVMPNSPRKPKEEFTAFHIPTARFLDIDEVASHTDQGSRLGLKHMMPDTQVFAQACGRTSSTAKLR